MALALYWQRSLQRWPIHADACCMRARGFSKVKPARMRHRACASLCIFKFKILRSQSRTLATNVGGSVWGPTLPIHAYASTTRARGLPEFPIHAYAYSTRVRRYRFSKSPESSFIHNVGGNVGLPMFPPTWGLANYAEPCSASFSMFEAVLVV